MYRNIAIDKSKEPLYQALAMGENAVFGSAKDLFLLAACIGYSQGLKTPLENSEEYIEVKTLDGPTDLSILNAIVLQDQKDLNALLGDEAASDQCSSIVEEYANAGAEVLKKRVLETPGDPLDNLMDLVFEQHAAETETKEESVTNVIEAIFK